MRRGAGGGGMRASDNSVKPGATFILVLGTAQDVRLLLMMMTLGACVC